MPIKDGWTTVKEIREAGYKGKIIAHTYLTDLDKVN